MVADFLAMSESKGYLAGYPDEFREAMWCTLLMNILGSNAVRGKPLTDLCDPQRADGRDRRALMTREIELNIPRIAHEGAADSVRTLVDAFCGDGFSRLDDRRVIVPAKVILPVEEREPVFKCSTEEGGLLELVETEDYSACELAILKRVAERVGPSTRWNPWFARWDRTRASIWERSRLSPLPPPPPYSERQ